MTRRDIEHAARLVVVEVLRIAPARVTEHAEFRDDLDADSLDKIDIVAGLERRFGVPISDDEASFAETFGTAIDLIESKLERRRAWPLPPTGRAA